MNEELWQQVEAWFHRLTDASTNERSSLLHSLHLEAPELEEEVLALLASDQSATDQEPLSVGRLQGSALWDEFADALEDGRRRPEADDAEPMLAGPFRVGRELGRGGMAVVHLGERVDGDFRQVVALKRLTGADRKGFTERLLAERRILAELRHPNIAQLIDGGTDSSGRPYLALEYIQGLPIDEYCDQHKLSLTERIKLFIQACTAVQHAHSKLVVHRDLKPSNILVDQRAQIKLLDFGIARILDPARDPGLTGNEARPLTPRYAAPEQFLGAPSTTATDIYGLGIVLFELLVGRLPYEVSGTDASSYKRAVLEQEAIAPLQALNTLSLGSADTTGLAELAAGRSTGVRQLRRSLRGDLRALFEKVLHKEPDRRYASAQLFAQDLQRYVDHRPLRAREPTVSYRLSRFVRRNRYALVATALVVASLTVGLVTAVVQAKEARRQKLLADAERESAVRVKDLLASIIVGADPDQTRQVKLTAVEFLERGLAGLAPQLQEHPEDLVGLLQEIQVIYRRIGDLERAAGLAHQIVDVHRGSERNSGALAQALYNLSLIEMDRGDPDSAEKLYVEILELEAERFAGDPDRSEVPDQRPFSLDGLGTVNLRRGEYATAREYYQKAIDGYQLERWKDDPRIAVIEGNLGFMLVQQGKYDEAKRMYLQVVHKYRRLYGEDHSRVSIALSNLGRIEFEQANLAEADKLFQQALAIDIAVYGPNHPSQSVDLAYLGRIQMEAGLPTRAIEWYERSLASLALRALDHPRVLTAQANLAEALVSAAEQSHPGVDSAAMFERARGLLDEVIPLLVDRYGEDHGRVLSASLSRLRVKKGIADTDTTLAELKSLDAEIRRALGEDHQLASRSGSLLEAWR